MSLDVFIAEAILFTIAFFTWYFSIKSINCIASYIYIPFATMSFVAMLINLFTNISSIAWWLLVATIIIALISYAIHIIGLVIYILEIKNKTIIKVYLGVAEHFLYNRKMNNWE